MVGEILGLFTSPITTIKEKVEEKNVKKEAIIAIVLIVVMAAVSILTTYTVIVKSLNKTWKEYEDRYDEKSDFKKAKKEAKEKALDKVEFGEEFFKTLGKAAIAIAVVAASAYVISRLMQSPLDFIKGLVIANRAFIIYTLGALLNILFIHIYAPIGTIIWVALGIYAFLVTIESFKEVLGGCDSNKLVIVTGITILIIVAIVLFIFNGKIDDESKGLVDISTYLRMVIKLDL